MCVCVCVCVCMYVCVCARAPEVILRPCINFRGHVVLNEICFIIRSELEEDILLPV
jgi:hypothetical protein